MSFSDWMHKPAVRRTLTSALLVAVAGSCSLFVWFFWPPFEARPPRHASGSLSGYLAETLDEDCRAILAAPPVNDPNPKQTEECADKAATQKYNYSSLEQSVRSTNAAESSAYFSYLQTRIGIIGALLVTLSLIFTGWAAYAAAVAARIAERVASQSDEAARILAGAAAAIAQSAEAAVRQADASAANAKSSEQAASIALQSLHTNRAWICIERFRPEKFHGFLDGKPVQDSLTISALWRNVGRTPALNLEMIIEVQMIDPGQPIPAFPLRALPEERNPGTSGPGQLSQSIVVGIDDESFAALVAGQKECVVYSRVTYTDVYTPSISRVTESCVSVSIEGGRPNHRGEWQPSFRFSSVGPNSCN